MNNGKSLGLDGIPCELCKVMWDIVGYDFSHMDLESFSMGCMTKFINQGIIKLIPKNSLKDTIGGWRPITLLSFAYKIMAKEMDL